MKASRRIVVVGAGAIGGITAALMRKAGEDVTLVCKHPEVTALATDPGLRISGICNEQTLPVPAVSTIDELTGTFDLALIATKAYDMPASARALLPCLTEDSLVVSLQNGICTDALAAVVGLRRTVGCVIGWGATLHAPGVMEMTSTGEWIIGRLEGDPAALEPLKAAMQAVVPAVCSDSIYAELYSKLIVNSCITSLGALCGLRLGAMLLRRQARSVFLAIIGEAMQVAHAMPLQVPPFGGRLDYNRLMRGNGLLDRLRRHTMIALVGLKYRRLKSSSLQSLERGRLTEIDYFNGYIADRGEALGVPCPINRRLTVMIKEIERGKRPIQVSNLYDPTLHIR